MDFSGKHGKAENNLQSPEEKITAEAYSRALETWEEKMGREFLGKSGLLKAPMHTWEWNRTESPEINPYICGQLIFNKDAKIIQ